MINFASKLLIRLRISMGSDSVQVLTLLKEISVLRNSIMNTRPDSKPNLSKTLIDNANKGIKR
jgi:hypothetical protein